MVSQNVMDFPFAVFPCTITVFMQSPQFFCTSGFAARDVVFNFYCRAHLDEGSILAMYVSVTLRNVNLRSRARSAEELMRHVYGLARIPDAMPSLAGEERRFLTMEDG